MRKHTHMHLVPVVVLSLVPPPFNTTNGSYAPFPHNSDVDFIHHHRDLVTATFQCSHLGLFHPCQGEVLIRVAARFQLLYLSFTPNRGISYTEAHSKDAWCFQQQRS